jgi:hypothetical protein
MTRIGRDALALAREAARKHNLRLVDFTSVAVENLALDLSGALPPTKEAVALGGRARRQIKRAK